MENFIINMGNALGWSIVHSIWQAAIWFIIYSICTMLYTKLSARAKHNLAFGTQISIFISFVVTFIYFYQLPSHAISLKDLNAEQLRNIIYNIQNEGFRFEQLLPYVVIGYFIGFIIQFLLLTNSLIKLKALKYKGLDSIPQKWNDLYYQAKKKLDLRQSVGIYLSNKISVPITLGHIKPFILFPIAYANKMDLAQVEAILLHELAHVKRQDYLFNLLKVGIETVMFFNPFIWALSKVIEREREHACDDLVIEHVSTPISYAQALVELEELRMSLNPNLTLAVTGKKNHLLNRIKRITMMEKNYKNVRPQLMAVLLSGVALITLAIIIPVNKSKAQENNIEHISSIRTGHMSVITDTIKPLKARPAEQPINAKEAPSVHIYNKNVITDTTELPQEVRNQIRAVQAQSKKIQEYYDSPEWKEKIKAIEKNAEKVQAHFDSPEWKNQIKKIEESAKDVDKYFQSEDWKKQMASIEKQNAKVQEYFESPEWKNKIKKIEEGSKEIEKYFESEDWKRQIASIEKQNAKITDHFNSPEWKSQMNKIAEESKKIGKYFESTEWKQKVKEWEKLEKSPEYKELTDKYQKDVQALKNKIKD